MQVNQELKRRIQDYVNESGGMSDNESDYAVTKLTVALQMGMSKLDTFAKEEGITEITRDMLEPMVEWAIRLATEDDLEKKIQKTVIAQASKMRQMTHED